LAINLTSNIFQVSLHSGIKYFEQRYTRFVGKNNSARHLRVTDRQSTDRSLTEGSLRM